jgi:hypothetical protein
MRAYAEETNRLNRERRASGEGRCSELAKTQRTLKQMLSVIEEGGHPRGMTDRMRELEAREDLLKELLASAETSGYCGHPSERVRHLSEEGRAVDGGAQLPRGS